MSIKVALTHRTTYDFARPVEVGPHVVRLRPAPHCRTPIDAYSLEITPKNHFLNWQQDPFGNWMARLVFPEKVSKLEIAVGLVADLMVINPLDFFIEEYAEQFPFAYEPTLAADLAPYLRPVDDSIAADAWREALPPLPDGRHGRRSRSSPTSTPPSTATSPTTCGWSRGCRRRTRPWAGGSARAATARGCWSACCGSTDWPPGSSPATWSSSPRTRTSPRATTGPTGPAADFTDLHAWTEVFIPGAGWVGLDPTSALFAGEGHIPLSATPHPSSAAPIEGATEPVEVTFGFVNEVHPGPRGPAGDRALHRGAVGPHRRSR